MENFNIAEQALETSLNSAGSAMQEHEKWQQSLEAQLTKLKSAWQSLSQSFMSSDFLKVALNFVIDLVDGIDKLISKVGTLPTLLGGFSLFAGISQILSAGKDVGNIKSFKGLLSVFKDTSNWVQILAKAFPKAASAISVFTTALAGSTGMAGLAKAATIGRGAISALWTAIKLHPILATVAAVGVAIAIFDKFTESAKELKERIEEVTTAYRDEHDELVKLKGDYDTSDADSMISKYGELSKGVNGLGENLSLTADEYSEYKSIVDTIAEQMPSLVTGYNSQGDAILSCAGNVDTLAEAYRNLIKEQNDEVLKNGSDIFKDFKNDLKDTTAYYKEQVEYFEDGIQQYKTVEHFDTDHLDELENLMNLSSDELEEYLDGLSHEEQVRISDLLGEQGIERNVLLDGVKGYETTTEHIIRALTKDKAEIKKVLDNAASDLNAYAEDMGTVTEAYFSTAFLGGDGSSIGDYSHLSERMQSLISQVTSNLGSDFYDDFLSKENPYEAYEALVEYYNNMLNSFDKLNSADASTLEAAFDLQTQFNGGEISYGEYVKGIQDVEKLVSSMDLGDEIKSQIKLALNTEEVTENYESLKERLTSDEYNIQMKTEEAEKFLNGLSASEYSVAIDLITSGEIDFSDFNIDSLREYIEKQEKLNEAMNFTITIDVETESIEALNTAMAESVSGTGLSSESIAALKGRYAELEKQGYNLSAMFEETSNGIHLNKKAVDELERAYASDKLSETQGNLDILKGRYDELTNEIDNCTDASERAGLYREQQTIVQKINDLGTLAAQYEGLASSYNAWQSAEEAGSERDMYESIIEGFETVGDEISRGWADDGTIKFLELLTGKTGLATKSGKELKEIWNSLDDTIKHTSYSVKDFFTVDEDGNSTSKGVYNFLDAIGQLEEEAFGGKDVVKRDDKGNIIGFDIELAGGEEAIAEALGVSEELVQIMLRAADDAGFVVTLDGNWTQFADLKNQAEEANDALKKIAQTNDELKKAGFGDYEFDFDANTVEGIGEELEKAKELLSNDAFKDGEGNFNINAEGAKEALKIAETLQIAKSKLEEPAYMSIDTTGLQEDLQEPVEQLQEFEKLTQERDLLNLTGTDKERLSEIDTELDKIATNLSELDEETKVKLGIDGMTPDQIREELENGTIEVPAELTIEANMDKSLEDLVTLGLLEQGLITEEEAKIRLNIDVEAGEVDTSGAEKTLGEKVAEATSQPIMSTAVADITNIISEYTPEEQEVVLEFIADPSQYENYTPEEKEAVVKFIADTIDVDGYTPEEKEAYARYIADGGNLDAYTPEEKQAIAKYLVDGGDIDNYTPEEKTAITKFLANTTDVDNYTPEQKQAIAKFIKDSIDVDNYQMPTNKWAYAKYLKDTYDIDIWTPPVKDGEASYTPSLASTFLPSITGLTAWYTPRISGGGKVNGTANVNGTAFASGTIGRAFKQGSWGTKDSGVALGGELGQETIVRDGRFFTIGDDGAEFFSYKKGDIIFNHKQTEELFRNGRVTSGGGRAKALVNGTAFVEGTAFSSGTGGGLLPEVKSYPVGSNKSSSSSSSSDDFEETLDWIETKIDRIERAIDQLDQKANNVYKSWSERNKALVSEIGKVEDEIAIQQAAYERYIKEANSVGLSSSWAEKARNGEIDIETITNESLADKISEYEDWYNKALDCLDAIEELKETEASLYAQRFQNVQSQYDGILQGFEHTQAMLDEYINQAEEKGYVVSKEYYKALIDNEKSMIDELESEQADLIAKRDEAVDSGAITKGSEEWYNMCAEIDSVTQAIEESTTALLEYDNAMREIDWEIFDLIQERISGIAEEADFLIELMSNDKLFDDDGKLTSQGLATMALHGQNYNSYMYAANEYGAEVAKLDAQIAKDPYDQELINRRNEMLELQRESILAAEDEKNAIADMVEEGIELELDALQELIDKKNEALESERDLYEYQKKVKEQTSEIASLEKQMAAYSGDDSEEAKQKIQQIKVDLEAARQDLQETEYDKLVDDTSALLDTLYNEYELILNQRLDNVDYLLEQVIESINAAASTDGTIASALGSEGAIAVAVSNNATSIKDTLASEAKNVGTTLSSAMNNIWSVGDGNAKSVLTMYGEDFRTKSTTTNATLNSIKTSVNSMVAALNKDAKTKTTANKTSTSAKKDPTKTTTTAKKTQTKKKSGGDGTPKIGDRVKYVSGQYYYDSQGKKPLGSHNQGKYVYITNINKKDWATHGYHISTGNKLGKGDLGWLKLNQLSGYATGKKDFLKDEFAWTQENGLEEYIVRPSDGAILTPIAKKGSVLNAQASSNLWDMTNSPAEFIRNNLDLGSANVPNASNVNNAITQNFENITFSMPNVHGYNELLTEMQRDPKFEKLIMAMTLDRVAGKSGLAKGKSIR